MKKILIIHPKDNTTDFLREAYDDIPCKTIINGNLTKNEIHQQIMMHDRIFMMGHGSKNGLYNVNNFQSNGFIIDSESVPFLRMKECIYLWCFASDFVTKHSLKGFSCGMFISEMSEAKEYNINVKTWDPIIKSNLKFSRSLAESALYGINTMYNHVVSEYGKLMKNPIVKYNHPKLQLFE
jgi:hypothetical protein